MTMFEILKPAPQRAIDVFDDHPQTMALGASRLGTNRVFKLPDAYSGAKLPLVPG